MGLLACPRLPDRPSAPALPCPAASLLPCLQLIKRVAAIPHPKAIILGNHDAW